MICSCRVTLHGFVQIFQVLLEASEISGDAPPEIFLLGTGYPLGAIAKMIFRGVSQLESRSARNNKAVAETRRYVMTGHGPSKTGVNTLLIRPSTPYLGGVSKGVDARHKAGHDDR